jgi:hypothetical protein
VKRRYRFLGRWNGRYWWESVLPVAAGDSRHEQISCDIQWFWGTNTAKEVTK